VGWHRYAPLRSDAIALLAILAVLLLPVAVFFGIGLSRLATPVSGPAATVRAYCLDAMQGNYADAYTWLAPEVTTDTQAEFVVDSQANFLADTLQRCSVVGRDIWGTIAGVHAMVLSVTVIDSIGVTYPARIGLDQVTRKGGRPIWLINVVETTFPLIPHYLPPEGRQGGYTARNSDAHP
jgi:hypothetical protein